MKKIVFLVLMFLNVNVKVFGDVAEIETNFLTEERLSQLIIEKASSLDFDFLDSLLLQATERGFSKIAQLLIDYGANVNFRDKKLGFTPLHKAVVAGSREVVEVLLRCGAEIDIKDFDGQPPLFLAVCKGQLEIVSELLKKGADVTVKDKKGFTPLYIAVENGHAEIVDELCKCGADVNVESQTEQTPLLCACSKGFGDIVKILLNYGVEGDRQIFEIVKDKDIKELLQSSFYKNNPYEYLRKKFIEEPAAEILSVHNMFICFTVLPLSLGFCGMYAAGYRITGKKDDALLGCEGALGGWLAGYMLGLIYLYWQNNKILKNAVISILSKYDSNEKTSDNFNSKKFLPKKLWAKFDVLYDLYCKGDFKAAIDKDGLKVAKKIINMLAIKVDFKW